MEAQRIDQSAIPPWYASWFFLGITAIRFVYASKF